MGRIVNGLNILFTREKCERTINYDKRDLKFEGVDAGMPSARFSFGNFESEERKIRDASEYAAALDDYQYQMCKICKSLGKHDKEWRKYNGLRVGTLHLLTTFRFILSAIERNPNSDTEKARLYDITNSRITCCYLLKR